MVLLAIPARAQASLASSPERAFIGNAGGDFGPGDSVFGKPAERAYNEFFLAMKQWRQYELVANPARTDWIFEISAGYEESCIDVHRRNGADERVSSYTYFIKLVMMDARMATRQTFTETVQSPGIFSNSDKMFDQAIVALMNDLKKEIGDAGVKTPPIAHNEPPAPVPARIGLAQRIFIHNLGASGDASAKYSGGGAQIYDQLALDLQAWGKYSLAPAAEADLIFDISFSVPYHCDGMPDPTLQLIVRDAKTDVLLWGVSRHIGYALLGGTARKHFVQGMADVVAELREVAETPTWAANTTLPGAGGTPAAVSLISAADVAAVPQIPVTISVPSPVVKSGAEVQTTVTLKNSFKTDLVFRYPNGDPLTCLLTVKDANGAEVANTAEGSQLKQAHSTWQGQALSYVLHPGEKQTRQCSVSALYEIKQPGKYLVEVTQLDGRAVKSNIATLTVK